MIPEYPQRAFRFTLHGPRFVFGKRSLFGGRCRVGFWFLWVAVAAQLGACATSEKQQPMQTKSPSQSPYDAPENAAFSIDGRSVRLQDGRAEHQAVPGSATRVETQILGEPVYGDLDGDGDEDAAVLMWQDTGGSGRFFFVAAALREAGGWRGTKAILIADRVSPTELDIQNGVVKVGYFDRGPSEPIAATPTLGRTLLAAVKTGGLVRVHLTEEQELFSGWLTIGHEVRSFRACERGADHWLLGEAQTLAALGAAYRESTSGWPPYMPVFAVVTGRLSTPSGVGFGADYDSALVVGNFIHAWPSHCHSDEIRIAAPRAGVRIRSPLELSGAARGSWFFEGDAPVVLLDAKGQVLATCYIKAEGEWMTRDFVPYTATLEFDTSGAGRWGTLVLKRDNPTGRVEHDRAVFIPVRFE